MLHVLHLFPQPQGEAAQGASWSGEEHLAPGRKDSGTKSKQTPMDGNWGRQQVWQEGVGL